MPTRGRHRTRRRLAVEFAFHRGRRAFQALSTWRISAG
jgi:hypothetical protein